MKKAAGIIRQIQRINNLDKRPRTVDPGLMRPIKDNASEQRHDVGSVKDNPFADGTLTNQPVTRKEESFDYAFEEKRTESVKSKPYIPKDYKGKILIASLFILLAVFLVILVLVFM